MVRGKDEKMLTLLLQPQLRRSYFQQLNAEEYFQQEVWPKVCESLTLIGFDDGDGSLKAIRKSKALALFKYFAEADEEEVGEISLDTFHSHFGIQRTKFSERIFSTFDFDQSGALSFEEFAVGVWNFLTMSGKHLHKFAIDIFDVEHLHKIDRYQIDALYRMIHDVEEVPQGVSERIENLGETMLSLDEFIAATTKHPELFSPVLQLQRKMRWKIFGVAFWELRMRARTEKHGEMNSTRNILLHGRKKNAMLRPTKSKVWHRSSWKIAEDGGKQSDENILEKSSENQREAKLRDILGAREENLKDFVPDDDDGAIIYDFAACFASFSLNEISSNQEEVLETFTLLQRRLREFLKARLAFQAQLPGLKVSEEVKAAFDAGNAKQSLINVIDQLETLGSALLANGEQQLYAWSLKQVEIDANEFFNSREGKELLQSVGRQFALEGLGDPKRWIVSREKLAKGREKARTGYILSKVKEQNSQIKNEIAKSTVSHEALIASTREIAGVLNSLEDELVSKWQWQRNHKGVDEEDRDIFEFFCHGLQCTIPLEPHLNNFRGRCEDPTCIERAQVRCISCAKEFCPNCDSINHSYGPARNHVLREPIASAETEWRDLIRKLPTSVLPKITSAVCKDPIEIARRNAQNHNPGKWT